MSALGSAAGLPAWHPPREVLEFAELVLSGALPATAVTIEVPEEHAGASALALEDAEGTPVAVLRRRSLDPAGAGPAAGAGAGGESPAGATGVAGPSSAGGFGFEPLRAFTHGPVRSARRAPVQVRAALAANAESAAGVAGRGTGAGGVLAVLVQSMLDLDTVARIVARASASGQTLLWLAVFGSGRPSALPAAGLWRAVREVAAQATPAGPASVAVPVAVPLPEGTEPADDTARLTAVARAYGAGEVVDPVAIASSLEVPERSPHPVFARERERAVPPPQRRGVTVFFTGLSGSGKSTVAKALADELAERSNRTVSLLDGDEVRRMLSAGLGFSRADRDLNIRRIGYVAAEVNRHGGIAICAPIAPFARTRAQVRAGVEEVGDFVLIHVSTPLAECERRDRKGLYAKARQGLVPDFTGISSPYEVPVDADLRLDTSRMDAGESLAAVWALLAGRGYLG